MHYLTIFLEVIGNAISEDSSKISKAKKRFEEIVEEAKQMQEEFEDYKEDEDIDPDSNDDDDLDDFLNSLGTPPNHKFSLEHNPD